MKESNLILSLIALAFSIMAFFSGETGLSSSGILAIIGICTTLIVGISVVDTLTIHRLEEKLEKQAKTIDELKELEHKVKQLKNQSNTLFHHTWGITYLNDSPHLALFEFWKALNSAVKTDDVIRAKQCLENSKTAMQNVDNQKSGDTIKISKIDNKKYLCISDEMMSSTIYKLNSIEIDEVLEKIKSLIEQ